MAVQPSTLQPTAAQMEQTLLERQRQQFLDEMKVRSLEKLSPNVVDDAFKYLKDFNISWNDDKKGYNPFMERSVEPSFKTDWLSSDLTSSVIERGSLSSSQMGAISSEKIIEAVGELAKLAGTSSATTTINAGDEATLTTTLTDNSDPNRILLAVPYITAFQTSLAGANRIPDGSSVTVTDWDIFTSPDWNSNNNRYASAISWLYNKSASNYTVYWYLHWRYLGKTAA